MNKTYLEGEADAPPLSSCLVYCVLMLMIVVLTLFIVWLNWGH